MTSDLHNFNDLLTAFDPEGLALLTVEERRQLDALLTPIPLQQDDRNDWSIIPLSVKIALRDSIQRAKLDGPDTGRHVSLAILDLPDETKRLIATALRDGVWHGPADAPRPWELPTSPAVESAPA